MTFLWCLAGAALILALVAWRASRRAARRLEQVSQMYWELKYQHGELRVQVDRLTGGGASASAGAPVSEPVASPPESFVPLASLKR